MGKAAKDNHIVTTWEKMMTMATIQVDGALKEEAEAVLTVSDLVQMLLTRIVREKAVPFEARQEKPDAEELKRRRDAVDFARVNCELEGLPVDDEFNDLHERYARGEINREDLNAYRDARLQRIIDAQAK
jgi:addiction module RelB/DinJ family antitoxin